MPANQGDADKGDQVDDWARNDANADARSLRYPE